MQRSFKSWKPKSRDAILHPLSHRQAIEIDGALKARKKGLLGELEITNAIRAAFGFPSIFLTRPHNGKPVKKR